jgi:hypothetical protein
LDRIVFGKGVSKAVVYLERGYCVITKKHGDDTDNGQYEQAIP